MCTKRKLKDFLEEISEGAEFAKLDYESPEKFNVLIKCKIAEEQSADYYNNYAKEWINKFSSFTNTAWVVRNCFPSLKRLVYRKSYWCHRSAQNKRKGSQSPRNLNCKARIDFRTKFITRSTVRNDPYLLRGLNLNISINFEHSHLVRDIASFNLLKSSSQTDAVFYEYFENGHTPTTAKGYHELLLIEKYGMESEELANANLNPNLRHIIYTHGKRWNQKWLDENSVMLLKTAALDKLGHTIKYDGDHHFVVILTRLMKRVVSQMGLEQVFVDSTVMSATPTITYLYIPTKIGPLPIACVVHVEKSEAIHTRIFSTLKLVIESKCNKNFEPNLLLLSDLQVKNALGAIFPNAIIKMNRYALCREIWEWISDDDNDIGREQRTRHDIMTLIKSLIYASSMAEAFRIHSELLGNNIMVKCFVKLEQIWQDREDWLVYNDCGGFNEAPIAFMKECITQRCKSFNMCAMVDVVTNILESHYKKIIISHTDENIIAAYTKLLPKINIDMGSEFFRRVSQNEFILQCKVKKKRSYHLNTDTMCCNCEKSVKGRMCEHLCSILNVVASEFVNLSPLPEEDKSMYLKLADDEAGTFEHESDTERDRTPIAEDERATSSLSKESDDSFYLEIKKEDIPDPLDYNRGIHTEDVPTVDMKLVYETAMKSVNDEFRRLNKLFKENPNKFNLETMTRLTKELGKIRSVEKVDFNNLFVQVNTTPS